MSEVRWRLCFAIKSADASALS